MLSHADHRVREGIRRGHTRASRMQAPVAVFRIVTVQVASVGKDIMRVGNLGVFGGSRQGDTRCRSGDQRIELASS